MLTETCQVWEAVRRWQSVRGESQGALVVREVHMYNLTSELPTLAAA